MKKKKKKKKTLYRERERKKKTTLQLYMLSHKPISLSKFLNQIKKKVRERKEPLTKQMYTKREGIPQGGLESMQYSRSWSWSMGWWVMSAIGEALSKELHKTRSHNTAKAKIVMKQKKRKKKKKKKITKK